MNSSPVVTDSDRQRGWTELEVEFLDGSRQFVRVHTLDQAELASLGKLSPAETQIKCLAKSLRVDRAFIARLHESSFFAAAVCMLLLLHGDVAAAAIVNRAAISLLQSQPQSVPGAFAEMMALGKSFREQLATMPKPTNFPTFCAALRAFFPNPA